MTKQSKDTKRSRASTSGIPDQAFEVGNIVQVEWYDHWLNAEYEHVKDIGDKDTIVTSIGQVIRVTPTVLSIGHTWVEDEGWKAQHIYRPLVKSVFVFPKEALR